jgi:hypothetical protein
MQRKDRRLTGAARSSPAPLAMADVLRLREAAQRYGDDARREKAARLGDCRARGLGRPRILAEYHDALLFIAAYADDEGIAAMADAELARCAEAAKVLADTPGSTVPGATGIAWCTIDAALSFDLARWLVERFPGHAEITSFGEGGARLAEVLKLALPALEADAIGEDDAPLDLLDRLKGRGASRLAFLVASLDRLAAAPAVRAYLYESLTPFITIEPRGSPASRTFLRGLPAPLHAQRAPLAKSLADPAAVIGLPLPAPRTLDAAERRFLVDTARATLAMLARETDPVTWPAESAVSLHALEGGWSVALYPMDPLRRFALDTHTGYLLFRNGVPLAYGGGWPFLRVCRTGINVFPAFRGGESALGFAQVLRVYRGMFGAARFVVEPYQFGAGNDEGLRSGAFWFYWRLGFRPVDAGIARRAEREFQRLRRTPGARTPLPRMRELAEADLALELEPLPPEQKVEPGDLALAATRWIAHAHAGDRRAAQRAAARHVAEALGVTGDAGWPAAERASFRSLALLLAQVDGLAAWSEADKAACVAILRAKGADDDAPFFRGLAAHARLPAALLALARKGREGTAG